MRALPIVSSIVDSVSPPLGFFPYKEFICMNSSPGRHIISWPAQVSFIAKKVFYEGVKCSRILLRVVVLLVLPVDCWFQLLH